MIDIVNVSKTFESDGRSVEAVRDVTLHIDAGDIFGVIGLSGAGKSTLIRCINLLERPTTGNVIVDGQDLTALSEKQLRENRKKIGMIFQHFNLMPSRTVYQNIAYPLVGADMSKEQKHQRILELLDLVGLADKEKAYPSQLSGGQKQRVAIARALANHPKVLLCDEATSALDPQTTRSILSLLASINKTMGLTIVLITHEMAVIKEICTRAAVMEGGSVVEEGRVIDLFANPKQPTTASFIQTASSLNKIDALLDSGSPLLALTPGDVLAKIRFTGANTMQSIVSTISRKYDIDVNIIFGDIEVVQDTPLGGIAAILHGEAQQVRQAVAYLSEQQIRVEVIKHG